MIGNEGDVPVVRMAPDLKPVGFVAGRLLPGAEHRIAGLPVPPPEFEGTRFYEVLHLGRPLRYMNDIRHGYFRTAAGGRCRTGGSSASRVQSGRYGVGSSTY